MLIKQRKSLGKFTLGSFMAPDDLHELEYARHLLENVLGWPAVRTNQELLGDCVNVVSKARKITKAGACDWLEVQIGKARKRGIKVNRWWLQEGEYNNLDEETVFRPTFQRVDPVKTKAEQETPEWLAASLKARELLGKIASGEHRRSTNTREQLKAQAEQIAQKRQGFVQSPSSSTGK